MVKTVAIEKIAQAARLPQKLFTIQICRKVRALAVSVSSG
jgi:hypothetical protein